jgi:CYTH domain-containing protein
MGLEIERRFLSADARYGQAFFRRLTERVYLVRQGYLALDDGNEFRVRVMDDGVTNSA